MLDGFDQPVDEWFLHKHGVEGAQRNVLHGLQVVGGDFRHEFRQGLYLVRTELGLIGEQLGNECVGGT